MISSLSEIQILDEHETKDRRLEALRVSLEIIENLDIISLGQLFEGYKGDQDVFLQELVRTTYRTLFSGDKDIIDKNPKLYVDKLSETAEEVYRVESLAYFIMSVIPNFIMNWHHIEWSDAVHRNKYLNMLASRDHGKSFFFSNAYIAWKLYRYDKDSKRKDLSILGKEGYLFSNTQKQVTKLMVTLKDTIESNQILKDRLYSNKNDGWAALSINCKNGSRVYASSMGESVRGAHPQFIVADDILTDQVIYSSEQREKSIDYFHSVIMNCIVPNGQVIVVGTPFHEEDLYANLRKSKQWHCREYPAIFPNGRVLWSDRYDLETLLEKRKTQGSTTFSREILCKPISDGSSLFPFNILHPCVNKNLKMVNNRESFPVKLDRISVGIDLAISANVAADYFVAVVLGESLENKKIYILNVYRLHGASFNEQILKVKQINRNFKPDIIVSESNAYQAIFGQQLLQEGLPVIQEATTSNNKTDLQKGVPGLALDFELGKIVIPSGDEYSNETCELVLTEFNSMTYTGKGISGVGSHDDIVMSTWQAKKGLLHNGFGGFGFDMM